VPTIISCAVTGGADNAHMNPAIPVTPGQIAAEALAARAAGAAVVHIHAALVHLLGPGMVGRSSPVRF